MDADDSDLLNGLVATAMERMVGWCGDYCETAQDHPGDKFFAVMKPLDTMFGFTLAFKGKVPHRSLTVSEWYEILRMLDYVTRNTRYHFEAQANPRISQDNVVFDYLFTLRVSWLIGEKQCPPFMECTLSLDRITTWPMRHARRCSII